MATKQFEIQGKLVQSSPVQVFRGFAGTEAWARSGGTFTNAQFYNVYSADITNHLSARGCFSIWFRISGSPSLTDPYIFTETTDQFLGDSNGFGVLTGSFIPQMYLRNGRGSGTNQVVGVTGTTGASQDAWHHFLVSWDISGGASYATEFHMYLDDVSIKPVSPTTFTAGEVVRWGKISSTFDGTMLIGNTSFSDPNIRLAQFYLNKDEYLDFSVEANRRKFINSSGLPVVLGTDGSLPTGTAPEWYFDNPAAVINTNRGTGADFTLGTTLIDVTGPGE